MNHVLWRLRNAVAVAAMLCVTMTTAAIEPVEEPIEPVTIIEETPPLVEKPPLELGKDYFFWEYEDNNVEYIEPVKMRITCYLPTGNKTADGSVPYEGICAAKREWMGKTAIVYDQNMRYVGAFEIRDTGGHPRIKNGTSIDIFRNTLERCYEYEREHGMYGYVQIVEADG